MNSSTNIGKLTSPPPVAHANSIARESIHKKLTKNSQELSTFITIDQLKTECQRVRDRSRYFKLMKLESSSSWSDEQIQGIIKGDASLMKIYASREQSLTPMPNDYCPFIDIWSLVQSSMPQSIQEKTAVIQRHP